MAPTAPAIPPSGTRPARTPGTGPTNRLPKLPLAGRSFGAPSARPHAHRATSMARPVSPEVILISVMPRTRPVAASMRPPHPHATPGTGLLPAPLRPNPCLTILSGACRRDAPGCPAVPPRLPAGASSGRRVFPLPPLLPLPLLPFQRVGGRRRVGVCIILREFLEPPYGPVPLIHCGAQIPNLGAEGRDLPLECVHHPLQLLLADAPCSLHAGGFGR